MDNEEEHGVTVIFNWLRANTPQETIDNTTEKEFDVELECKEEDNLAIRYLKRLNIKPTPKTIEAAKQGVLNLCGAYYGDELAEKSELDNDTT